MSLSKHTICDGCGRSIEPGAAVLGVYLEETIADAPFAPGRKRRRRLARREANADLCADCRARPLAMGALLDRLDPPRETCGVCKGTGDLDGRICGHCDGEGVT